LAVRRRVGRERSRRGGRSAECWTEFRKTRGNLFGGGSGPAGGSAFTVEKKNQPAIVIKTGKKVASKEGGNGVLKKKHTGQRGPLAEWKLCRFRET